MQSLKLQISDIAPVSSMEFLDIQATIECGLTLKRVRDMIRTIIDAQKLKFALLGKCMFIAAIKITEQRL